MPSETIHVASQPRGPARIQPMQIDKLTRSAQRISEFDDYRGSYNCKQSSEITVLTQDLCEMHWRANLLRRY